MPGLHIDLFSLSWHSLSVNKIHMIFDLQLRLYRQFIYKKKISPLHPCACLLFFSLHSLFGFHSFSFNTLLLMLWSAKCCYYNIVFFLYFSYFSLHTPQHHFDFGTFIYVGVVVCMNIYSTEKGIAFG